MEKLESTKKLSMGVLANFIPTHPLALSIILLLSLVSSPSKANVDISALVPIVLYLLEQDTGECLGIEDSVNSAIYVDTATGLNGNDGSIDMPVSSINQGISLALLDDTIDHVFVSQGIYQGTVTLYAGIKLYGGFNKDWERCDSTRTIIRAPEVGVEMVANTLSPMVLDGFRILTGFSTTVTGSIYGVRLTNSRTPVTIQNNFIATAQSADGDDGESFTITLSGEIRQRVAGNGSRGGLGKNGVGGIGAFDAAASKSGGSAGGSSCAAGGKGGSSGLDTTSGKDGDDGEASLSGQVVGDGGDGGDGGNAAGSCLSSGKDGDPGDPGTSGASGSPGRIPLANVQNLGSYNALGFWLPGDGPSGSNATDGTGGGGGGGGGGGRRVVGVCKLDIGGSGGGGGGAGCGGKGGGGGKGGEGSFAIYLGEVQNVIIQNNSLRPGRGGAGGIGGVQQNGGSGGDGRVGGNSADQAGGGGDGGDGGNGGEGGAGAGGAGGPSACLWAAKTSAITETNNYCLQNNSPAPGGNALNMFLGSFSFFTRADDGEDGRVETFFYTD